MSTEPVASEAPRIKLESRLPETLPPGCRTSVFCFGHCFAASGVGALELLVDGVAHRPSATGMPRRDLQAWLAGTREDPGGRSYRSGFWAALPVHAPPSGALELRARVRTGDGAVHTAHLGSIRVAPAPPLPWAGPELSRETIFICLASFEPDLELLAAQLESLRAQTDERWVCLVSDGGSEPERFRRIQALAGGDPRFVFSRSEGRLGPYENFERALGMVPRRVELVALCDQDDRWYPDKLATLRAALGPAQLVYSDQRLVDASGRVLRASLWEGRRNDHRNLASLLVANAVPGAAMLFRRELIEVALPFPQPPGNPYHDHWLALAALASGEIRFVDRPLFDWVQHGAAASRGTGGRGRGSWRGAYFGGYVLRQLLAQTLLARCGPELTPRHRRALRWFMAAERAPWPFLWLALRPLRRLVGRDETLSGEVALTKGVLWRWLVAPSRRDAAFPDPPQFEQPRLRRWRSGA
jgi:Glycosyl transferase family 2